MKVEISTELSGQADEHELRSLLDWLQQESPRPGKVELLSAEPVPGTMGAISDTLQVALGAGGAVTVLAGSVTTWIRTRRQAVTLRFRRPDGEELLLDAEVKDPERAIEQFFKGAHDMG
jgi:Effector Associated Constant Component 1